MDTHRFGSLYTAMMVWEDPSHSVGCSIGGMLLQPGLVGPAIFMEGGEKASIAPPAPSFQKVSSLQWQRRDMNRQPSCPIIRPAPAPGGCAPHSEPKGIAFVGSNHVRATKFEGRILELSRCDCLTGPKISRGCNGGGYTNVLGFFHHHSFI